MAIFNGSTHAVFQEARAFGRIRAGNEFVFVIVPIQIKANRQRRERSLGAA
jgi:hypothetical protein